LAFRPIAWSSSACKSTCEATTDVPHARAPWRSAPAYLASVAIVTASALVAWFGFGEAHLPDVVMVFLLGVVIVSTRFGYGPSLLAAVMSVLAFEFFFIPPLFSFAVSDLRHAVTFGVMFLVAFVISHQTQRLRDHAESTRIRERDTAQERMTLAEEARRDRLRIETEQLRNALLSSVSHDLRTPLAVVTGATSTLLERPPEDEAKRRTLLRTAHEEALRLNRLVHNLLDMTRLEAGALNVSKELQPLEEVVGAALNRVEDRLRGREIGVSIPAELPLVRFDPVLIEQVLINLLENATKHTPAGGPIDLSARACEGEILVELADRGPGIAAADAERVFDKFCRLRETEGGGVGLGLTICRGVVVAHGGRMWVEERDGGGACFRFTLPLEGAPGPMNDVRRT
jgi:K+-sensing histidine kinase KdpD